MAEKKMVDPKSWNEFREAGLLWWINRILHTFGWAIVTEVEQHGDNAGKVTKAYPARVKFRGFGRESEENGFRKVSHYMSKNHKYLRDESHS